MARSEAAISTVSTGVRTALYRHFDAAGNLLYVGISLNAVARLAQHRREAHWFDSIARIDVEWHPSRCAAETAERAAILAERPAHNIAHAYGMTPWLEAELRRIGKLHLVDGSGFILPQYASLTPQEADALADRLG